MIREYRSNNGKNSLFYKMPPIQLESRRPALLVPPVRQQNLQELVQLLLPGMSQANQYKFTSFTLHFLYCPFIYLGADRLGHLRRPFIIRLGAFQQFRILPGDDIGAGKLCDEMSFCLAEIFPVMLAFCEYCPLGIVSRTQERLQSVGQFYIGGIELTLTGPIDSRLPVLELLSQHNH